MDGEIQHDANRLVEPTGQGQANGSPPSSPVDLDTSLCSWTGERANAGAGIHNSASGPVLAEPVLTEPKLTEVNTTEPQPLQSTARLCGSCTTVSDGKAAAPDDFGYDLTDPVATDELAPAPVHPAVAAVSVGPGNDLARGVAAPAGAPSPELASASIGKESGTTQEDMDITDADLLDISAVLMSEEGPLDIVL